MEELFNNSELEQIKENQYSKINVVNAKFQNFVSTDWKEIFSGFNELYAITFSSGINFMGKVLENFKKAEVIFGFENIMPEQVTAAMFASQIVMTGLIAKSEHVTDFAERIKNGELHFFISRTFKSHEKIFILKSDDGRKRVITGSANFSANAFTGIQRENIFIFDDDKAFEYFMALFHNFKNTCSDDVNYAIIERMSNGEEELLHDNLDQIPIAETVAKKGILVIEQSQEDAAEESNIVADIKGLEKELKPLMPRPDKKGKIVIKPTDILKAKTENTNIRKEKKEIQKQLPKLHIDYDAKSLSFNGKSCNLTPDEEDVRTDILCILQYLDSISNFYGETKETQYEYYKLLNWYFASIFMPYLRILGHDTGYSPEAYFPVYAVISGESDCAKTTFVKLLSKLMCGKNIPPVSKSNFQTKNIINLKRGCEGLPLYVDDIEDRQYKDHFINLVKDDEWGLLERFINYPAVVVTTNKVVTFEHEISKRTVIIKPSAKIDTMIGKECAKKITDSFKKAKNAFFCEYMRRMFPEIDNFTDIMKEGNKEFVPDIFNISSRVLKTIITENCRNSPEYVASLTLFDYFGNTIIGRDAIKTLKETFQKEPSLFKIRKRQNELIYKKPDNAGIYILNNLKKELPNSVEAKVIGNQLVMNLKEMQTLCSFNFNKSFWR